MNEHHRANGEVANQMNQHIEMPQIQFTDKVADKSVAVQRQVSQRTTETNAPEYIEAVAGKYQWDDRPGGDADKDVQGEAITKYCWSEGRNTVSIHLELDGLDDVTDDAFKVESGKTNVSLTIASVAGKQRIFKLTGLTHVPRRKENGRSSRRRKRRLGTSCSMMLQRRRQSWMTPRVAIRTSHLVSAKRH